MVSELRYRHAGSTHIGCLVGPGDQRGPRPGILVAHGWAGRTAFEQRVAERLARLGWVGFALDAYGAGRTGSSPAENEALMRPLLADRTLLRGRLRAALDALRAQRGVDPERLAAVGFCFGGLCALDLARSGAPLRGVVSFHGGLRPPGLDDNPASFSCRVLALHGAEDPFVPLDELAAFGSEMTRAGADWQLHVFGGARHAFAHPESHDPARGCVYDPRIEQRAWALAEAFLTEVLA